MLVILLPSIGGAKSDDSPPPICERLACVADVHPVVATGTTRKIEMADIVWIGTPTHCKPIHKPTRTNRELGGVSAKLTLL